jgi:hypothetical protein
MTHPEVVASLPANHYSLGFSNMARKLGGLEGIKREPEYYN